MIIEFADPGYMWGFVGFAVLAFVAGIVLFLLPFWVTDDEKKVAMWPMFGLLLFIIAPSLILGSSAGDYSTRVAFEKMGGLESEGFSNIDLSGDRFTAATPDGEYFSGILVDLRPGSGYAYQVLEITDTPTK